MGIDAQSLSVIIKRYVASFFGLEDCVEGDGKQMKKPCLRNCVGKIGAHIKGAMQRLFKP